jgi:hypothetical protein
MAGFTKRTLAHSSAMASMPSARDAGICDCRAAGLSRQALPTLDDPGMPGRPSVISLPVSARGSRHRHPANVMRLPVWRCPPAGVARTWPAARHGIAGPPRVPGRDARRLAIRRAVTADHPRSVIREAR